MMDDMNDSPLALDIDINDLEPEAVDRVSGYGVIKDIKLTNPNDKGNQFLSLEIEYPLDSPETNVVRAGLTFNRERMLGGTKISQQTDLTEGQKKFFNRNAARLKELKLATGESVFTNMKGKVVGFKAGPKYGDVTEYEFTGFYPQKTQ